MNIMTLGSMKAKIEFDQDDKKGTLNTIPGRDPV